jgi:hypothetical protein
MRCGKQKSGEIQHKGIKEFSMNQLLSPVSLSALPLPAYVPLDIRFGPTGSDGIAKHLAIQISQ